MIKYLIQVVEQGVNQSIHRFFSFSKEPLFPKVLSILLIIVGILLGWTRPPVSPLFFEKVLRILLLVTLLAFLVTRQTFFYKTSLLAMLFYPLLIFLTPSGYHFVIQELDKLVSLKSFMTGQIFESNLVNLDITDEDINYFIGFGYYVSAMGFLIGIRELRNLKFVVKSIVFPASFLIGVWILLFSSIFLMERDYPLGKGIYLLLKRINSISHCIDYYDYLYFKAGEFDQRKGRKSWENIFYQAILYKNNSYFKQSLGLLKEIRSHKRNLIDLELADLVRKVSTSELSITEKIDLLKDISLYYHDPDIKIYLACFYMKYKAHHSSISLIQDTLPVVRNKFILSDLYNLLGDIYGELRETNLSRYYYTKSLHTYDRVKSGNFHAYKGLSGW